MIIFNVIKSLLNLILAGMSNRTISNIPCDGCKEIGKSALNILSVILFQEYVVSVTEPYAVNEDLSPIESKQEKEKGIVPMIEQVTM